MSSRQACPQKLAGRKAQQAGLTNFKFRVLTTVWLCGDPQEGGMGQSGWVLCTKCLGMWYGGNGTAGYCPKGGGHEAAAQSWYTISTSGSGQANWRWCNKCQGLFYAGNSLGVCPSHSHSSGGSDPYVLSTSGKGQSDWRWCSKRQGLFYTPNGPGVCPLDHQTHKYDPGDPNFVLSGSGSGQPNWKYCHKCEGLFYTGNNMGLCPKGGTHDPSGSGPYVLSQSGPGQINWRLCNQCQGLFFAYINLGACPAPNTHNLVGSGDYVLSTSALPNQGEYQSDWHLCTKCQGLFSGTNDGVCPVGGTARRREQRLCDLLHEANIKTAGGPLPIVRGILGTVLGAGRAHFSSSPGEGDALLPAGKAAPSGLPPLRGRKETAMKTRNLKFHALTTIVALGLFTLMARSASLAADKNSASWNLTPLYTFLGE